MSMQMKATILGAKSFKGNVDGRDHDSTTLFVQMMLDDSTGTAKGYTGSPIKWGTSEEYKKIAHLPFPFEAELTIELMTSGTKQKQVCTALRPVGAPKVDQKAAA